MPKRNQVTIVVDPVLREWLDARSAAEGHTVSSFARRILTEAMRFEEQAPRAPTKPPTENHRGMTDAQPGHSTVDFDYSPLRLSNWRS
jgi:hypothetical protein